MKLSLYLFDRYAYEISLPVLTYPFTATQVQFIYLENELLNMQSLSKQPWSVQKIVDL